MATRTATDPSPVHPIPANGRAVLFGPLVDGTNIEVGDFTQLGPDSGPTVITNGPDGALRFTEYRAHRIGRITTDGRVTEFSVPTPECGPFGYRPTAGRCTVVHRHRGGPHRAPDHGRGGQGVPLPRSGVFPSVIAAGRDAMWFTMNQADAIGRVGQVGTDAAGLRSTTCPPRAPHLWGSPSAGTEGSGSPRSQSDGPAGRTGTAGSRSTRCRTAPPVRMPSPPPPMPAVLRGSPNGAATGSARPPPTGPSRSATSHSGPGAAGHHPGAGRRPLDSTGDRRSRPCRACRQHQLTRVSLPARAAAPRRAGARPSSAPSRPVRRHRVTLREAGLRQLPRLVPHQATFALSTTARRCRSSAWRFRQMM